jgi:hypothetical protein
MPNHLFFILNTFKTLKLIFQRRSLKIIIEELQPPNKNLSLKFPAFRFYREVVGLLVDSKLQGKGPLHVPHGLHSHIRSPIWIIQTCTGQ